MQHPMHVAPCMHHAGQWRHQARHAPARPHGHAPPGWRPRAEELFVQQGHALLLVCCCTADPDSFTRGDDAGQRAASPCRPSPHESCPRPSCPCMSLGEAWRRPWSAARACTALSKHHLFTSSLDGSPSIRARPWSRLGRCPSLTLSGRWRHGKRPVPPPSARPRIMHDMGGRGTSDPGHRHTPCCERRDAFP
jgi:hypothetical protein